MACGTCSCAYWRSRTTLADGTRLGVVFHEDRACCEACRQKKRSETFRTYAANQAVLRCGNMSLVANIYGDYPSVGGA